MCLFVIIVLTMFPCIVAYVLCDYTKLTVRIYFFSMILRTFKKRAKYEDSSAVAILKAQQLEMVVVGFIIEESFSFISIFRFSFISLLAVSFFL